MIVTSEIKNLIKYKKLRKISIVLNMELGNGSGDDRVYAAERILKKRVKKVRDRKLCK